MDKQEYIALKSKPLSEWTREECAAADRLIEKEALKALREVMAKAKVPTAIYDFVDTCARAHMGSVETDEMLMALKCYPEWK